MLVRDLGVDAYSHARQEEREADSIGEAQEWKRVARAIASKTGKRGAVDSISPQGNDDSFIAYAERYVAPPRTPADQPEPVNRLRSLGAPSALLQPQLLSPAPHGGAALKKVGLRLPAAPAAREIEVLRPLAAAPDSVPAQPDSDQSQPPPMGGKDAAGGDTAAEAQIRSSLQQEREKIAILLQSAPEPTLRRMLESASSQLNLVENCLSEAGMARRRTADELAWWLRQTEELLSAAAIYTKCVSDAVAKSSARARSSQSG